jgi:glycosyltransferase involved in cell wall biosynthesis
LYGSDQVVLRVLKELASRVDPIVVIESEGEFADRARAIPCEVVVRNLGVLRRRQMHPVGLANSAWHIWAAAAGLARLIRQRRVPVVLTSTVSVLAAAIAAKLTGRPHIWLVQEILGGKDRLLSGLVSGLSSRIVAVSDASARSIHHGRPRAARRTSIFYPGVDARRFDQADGAALRHRFRTEPGQVLIGLVARIHYWKGQDYFLEALAALRRRGVSGFRALLVGDHYAGYEYLPSALREQARLLGLENDVAFCGHIDDVASVFNALDIVVAPSTQPEPFGLAVVEAMAARRPVIATAAGGPLEIIEDGVDGFLIPIGSPAVFGECLERLIRDPGLRRRIGEAARKKVETAFPAGPLEAGIRREVESAIDKGRG